MQALKQVGICLFVLFFITGCGSSDEKEGTDNSGTSKDPITIHLIADSHEFIEVFSRFVDYGAIAETNKGELLDVTVHGEVNTEVLGDYILTYKAQDNAGNKAEKERTVSVVDTTPPVIKLNRGEVINLVQGQDYIEYGATAEDRYDGLLEVQIDSNFKKDIVDEFTVTYTSVDLSGNKTSKDRLVIVHEQLQDQEYITDETLGKLVLIPSGRFLMGSEEGYEDEQPVHEVYLSSFYMMEHQVTYGMWNQCVADGVCHKARDSDNEEGEYNRPVIWVSWNDINDEFLPWLNQASGKNFRLPSESEWEYAARAGTTTEYYTGSCIYTDQANFDGTFADYNDCGSNLGDFLRTTQSVKSYAPNVWGLYDMHGNVWEWVQDCLNRHYIGAPNDGSAWERGDCGGRMIRGGSWQSQPESLRSAYRDVKGVNGRMYYYGFRLVLDNEA